MYVPPLTPRFITAPANDGVVLTFLFYLKTLRQLVQSILDQSHLTPSTTYIQPVLPEYDHAMRLYPLPTCVRVTPIPFPSMFLPFHTLRDAGRQVVLADKYDSYRMTYEGCHVFNPGRFLGRSLGFSTYTPASRESEAWYVIYYTSPPPPFLVLPVMRQMLKSSVFLAPYYQRHRLGGRELTVHTDMG